MSSNINTEFDARDEVWNAIWRVQYEVRFNATLSRILLDKWTKFDDVAKVLIALFASGSALSGWALWDSPSGKNWWLLCAGLTSIIATVHAALGVSGRVKGWGELKRHLLKLVLEVETFQEYMRIHPEFEIETAVGNLEKYREQYASSLELMQSDFLVTERLENKIQDKVNESFGISNEGG